MKAVPIAGALVLGFGVVLFLSSFRATSTHRFRSSHGEADFEIDIPRGFTVRQSPDYLNAENLEGRLPSGGAATLYLQSHRYATSPKGFPDEPFTRREKDGVVQETWADGGWKWTLESRNPRTESGWIFKGTLQRHDLAFTVFVSPERRLTDEDRMLLDRCLRSLRWIGGAAP